MKKILLICLILICVKAEASQRIFYSNGLIITDASGQKTKAQIEQEFGLTNVEMIIIDEKTEIGRIENGKLKKYNYKDEQDQKKAEKKARKDKAKQELKELGLTDEAIDGIFNQ